VAVPLSYITIIASPDEQTKEAAPKSKGTAQFVGSLPPMVRAKLNGPIGSTSLPPIQYISRSNLPKPLVL
jgi:hypothetical protein